MQLPEVPQGRKNPLWMGFQDRVRRMRNLADLSMNQLSLAAGIAHTTVADVEKRGRVPGIDLVEKLATGLGVSPAWLAFGWSGWQPFVLKQPRPAIPHDDPAPAPGSAVFQERYRTCGARLQRCREQAGLTLRDVVTLTSDNEQRISHQAVLYVENGQIVPKLNTLEAIARALQVPPSWLAYGEEEE